MPEAQANNPGQFCLGVRGSGEAAGEETGVSRNELEKLACLSSHQGSAFFSKFKMEGGHIILSRVFGFLCWP